MKLKRYCTYYVRQGTGFVGRVFEETDDKIIVFNLVTLIGETVQEVLNMAHNQYGVPSTNMRRR